MKLENTVVMGTCLSKNLMRWLGSRGISDCKVLDDILFTPYAIETELYRSCYNENWKHYIKTDEIYYDNIRTWTQFRNIEDYYTYTIKKNAQIFLALKSAKNIFISFGILELWKYNGMFLNYIPKNRGNPEKYELIEPSYKRAKDSIENILKCLGESVNKECRIIITVCPVQQKYTWTQLSLEEVSLKTKKCLIKVCLEMSRKYEHVIYFPGYEYVEKLKTKVEVYQEDKRHLTSATLNQLYLHLIEFLGVEIDDNKLNETFWAPAFSNKGKIVGKLYVDARMEYGTDFLSRYIFF